MFGAFIRGIIFGFGLFYIVHKIYDRESDY
jgi:hypothetical protein